MRSAAVLGVLVLAGCGGGMSGPTPVSVPTPAPAVTARVLDGITGRPVTAAGPSSGQAGTMARYEAAGYLPRDTRLPADGVLFLWPITVSEEWIRTVVYHEFSPGRRLIRWAKTDLLVAEGIPQAVVDELNSTGAVRARYGAPADIDWSVAPERLPTATANAAMAWTLSGDTITHGTALLRDGASIRNERTMKHEIVAHGLGLGHSSRRDDLSYAVSNGGDALSADERILLAMMYGHRRAGQVAPDNDQTLSAASVRQIVVVD